MMKRLDIITFLKGYSMFTIVLFHSLLFLELTPLLNKAVLFGGTGVHLFILLSGFGLYLSFLNKPLNFLEFLKRRFGKIYIPYVTIVIISALIALVIPIYEGSWYAFFGHLLFYKMFDNSIIGSYGYQLWFVSTIIQFYLIFQLLVLLKKHVSNYLFIILGLLVSLTWSGMVVLLGKEELRNWNSFFLQYLWEFMLGMVIADMLKNNKLKFSFKKIYFFIIGVICIAFYGIISIKMGQIGKAFNDIPALLGYSCLAIFIFQLNIKAVNKFFLFTGNVAFPLYLVHVLILLLADAVSSHTGISRSIMIFIAILVSFIISFYYEKMVAYFYRMLNI
jgi:peptidoglycan/LPS O-acetylase OafA/YrhL